MKPNQVERDTSREWTQRDRVAGVIPLACLRVHGTEALELVATGRKLTVLRYGRPVALLVPLYGERPE